jgi:hypothetical protein
MHPKRNSPDFYNEAQTDRQGTTAKQRLVIKARAAFCGRKPNLPNTAVPCWVWRGHWGCVVGRYQQSQCNYVPVSGMHLRKPGLGNRGI